MKMQNKARNIWKQVSAKKHLVGSILLVSLVVLASISVLFLQSALADEGDVSTLNSLDDSLYLAFAAYNESGSILYVISGHDGSYSSDDVMYINISSNTTGTYTNCIPDSGRYQAAFAVNYSSHTCYIFGGYKNTGSESLTNTILAWNWDNKTGWDTGATIAGVTAFRVGQACYVDSTHDIWIIGGRDNSGTYLSDIRRYNPSNNSCWDTNEDIVNAVAYSSAVYDTKRDLIWIIGGYDGSSLVDDIIVLNPDNYQSKIAGHLPYALSSFYDAVYNSVNDTILIAGGYTSAWDDGTNDIIKLSLSGTGYDDVSVSSSIVNNLTGVTWVRESCGVYCASTNTYYIATGRNQNDNLLNTVWSYDLPDPTGGGEWSSSVTVFGLVGSQHNFTFSGDVGTTVWTNTSAGAGGTAQFYICANSTDNFTEFRMYIGDWGSIGASNFSVTVSSDNTTWGTNGRSPSNGGGNITINSSLWTTANGCYGSNPFPFQNKNASIYVRLKISIPSNASPSTTTYQNWKWWSKREY